MTENASKNPRHTAPPLANVDASLYPFVRKGRVDVSGGHHDAGDYSKYTINVAHLIHVLVFAADSLPGVGALDNLGLPESGDGKSDILQEAKWEADFLSKMQDTDGGFYFLVYPRYRAYEHDVLPDQGDPQVVFPKTTAVTAAATAALAQIGSSPRFRKQFPESAAKYLSQAKLGWTFLQQALEKHGRDGSYQKVTHYGDEFMHDDELAWAAAELYAATGEKVFHDFLRQNLNPDDGAIRRWSWWRMWEAYGNAIRSYTFASRSGRLPAEALDPRYLVRCEAEIVASADDQARAAAMSAYNTSFPEQTKRVRAAGWYFASDRAFDCAVASALEHPEFNDPRPRYLDAVLGNINYELGSNPVNVPHLTGTGWKRQAEVVHHVAQNDRRELPPTGIVLGSLQEGFAWLEHYGKELGNLTFPSDGAKENPYPFYDRWGDSFNVATEFVVVNQARSLASMAWLMAQTPLKSQPWKSGVAPILIEGMTARLRMSGEELSKVKVTWETPRGARVLSGRTPLPLTAEELRGWIEAEVLYPDGRRLFGIVEGGVVKTE